MKMVLIIFKFAIGTVSVIQSSPLAIGEKPNKIKAIYPDYF